MPVKKIIKILILFFLNYNLLNAMEVDSKLENNIYITRSIFRESDYSICIINGLHARESEPILDFSYENNFIRAGRIKRLGIWRELFTPLGVSANSNLFNETEGFDNNYLFNKGGLYGVSLELGKKLVFSLLFPEDLWVGLNYTKLFQKISITAFISGTAYTNKTMEDWTSDSSIIPNTNPIHTGLRSVLKLHNFTLDYLGSISGSTIYKTGNYNRLFFEVYGKDISFKGYGGIISPYFINTDLVLSDTKYLLSLYLWKRVSKNWDFVFKTKYQEDQAPVLPVSTIPSSGGGSANIIFNNSVFIFSNTIEQKFNFDIYGNAHIENSIEGKMGVSGKVSSFFYYGYTFDFNSLLKRQFQIQLKSAIKSTDLEFVFKHCEDGFESLNQNSLRFRFDQKIGNGDVFFKIELGNKLELEQLSIGFKYVFLKED